LRQLQGSLDYADARIRQGVEVGSLAITSALLLAIPVMLWSQEAAPLEKELLVQADRLVGGKDAVLVIDDTAMPKKGDRSVGVAPQYASSVLMRSPQARVPSP
jgi:DDE superfamily endonuclease